MRSPWHRDPLTFYNRILYSIFRIYGDFLENFILIDHYDPIKTALKELGFTVDFVEKRAHKTVITVSHCEKDDKGTVSARTGGNGYEAPRG